jgi:CheY-like chemotaxis protein
LKLELSIIGVERRSEFYINGQEVIDRVNEYVRGTLKDNRSFAISPVHCIITDFQMPIKNGLDTVKEVRSLYKTL